MSEQLSLIPDEPVVGELEHIALDHVVIGPGIEPETALIQSMQRFGLLQPIIVERRQGRYHVCEGRRRYRAAVILGWPTIACWVLPTGQIRPQIVQLASHAMRSRNKAAEVDAVDTLLKEGHSERDIADAIGLTVQEVRALFPLTMLPDTFRSALRDGSVAASVATNIAKLPAVAQERLVKTYYERGTVSATDVREQRLARTQAAVADLGLDSLDVPDVVPEPDPPQAEIVLYWPDVIATLLEIAQAPTLAGMRERLVAYSTTLQDVNDRDGACFARGSNGS